MHPILNKGCGSLTIQMRTVAVRQLPETLSAKQGRIFFREIQCCMNVVRPRMVLDCSNLRLPDSSVIYLLLCCLEEAMKRKGDVKLAALPPGAWATLEITGASRLFAIYDTTTEAVNSFHPLPAGAGFQIPVPVSSQRESTSAA